MGDSFFEPPVIHTIVLGHRLQTWDLCLILTFWHPKFFKELNQDWRSVSRRAGLYPTWSRVYPHLDVTLVLNVTPVHKETLPNFCFRPSRYRSPQSWPVFLAFSTFTNVSMNILTDAGHQAIVWTACSFSCSYAWVGLMSFCHHHMSQFVWNEDATPRKMIPLWIAKLSFCWSKPFFASEHCFQFPIFIFFMASWKIHFDPSSVLMSN